MNIFVSCLKLYWNLFLINPINNVTTLALIMVRHKWLTRIVWRHSVLHLLGLFRFVIRCASSRIYLLSVLWLKFKCYIKPLSQCHVSIYINTGVKQCTFHWLISNDIAQNEMVYSSLIIHHMIMITCISYAIMFTISVPILITIAPL